MGRSARSVLEEWLSGEMDAALEFAAERLRREIPLPGLRGLLASMLVERARKLGLKKIRFLLQTADGPGGAEDWMHYAQLQEVYRRARKDHPRFPLLESALRKAYARASGLVARLLRGEGETMEEVLRSAYPARADARAALQRELEILDAILEIVERNPDLISFPGPVREPWLRLTRQTADFSRERLLLFVESAYRE